MQHAEPESFIQQVHAGSSCVRGPVLSTVYEGRRERSQTGLTETHRLMATKLHMHLFTFCLGNPASRNLLNYQTKAKV